MRTSDGAPGALTVVGPGRVGGSIAHAARKAGLDVLAVGREPSADLIEARCVLICAPDSAIAEVAEVVARCSGTPDTIGHVSGATSLAPLAVAAPRRGCFSLHPLQTVPRPGTSLAGAHAAIAGDCGASLAVVRRLAETLGMEPFEVAEEDRATYHAAASIASNFLIALEESAAGLLGDIAVERPREVLAPLVRRSLENWIEHGPAALTGPIARGDVVTVERHRDALRRSDPGLLAMYDAMAERTSLIAGAGGPA
jgi:predicted short-subunit dehydrogenase-like oxidoreductase (DUF2520 family)